MILLSFHVTLHMAITSTSKLSLYQFCVDLLEIYVNCACVHYLGVCDVHDAPKYGTKMFVCANIIVRATLWC